MSSTDCFNLANVYFVAYHLPIGAHELLILSKTISLAEPCGWKEHFTETRLNASVSKAY
jgi:hypothetical protein